jgi:uncharacterized membrane protein
VRSETRVRIAAPLDRVFDLGAEVERWPERLPHYRYVRRLATADGERRFAMGARRGPIPVRWEAIQRPLRDARRIEFRHTDGVTRGMQVAWLLHETDGTTHVTILHELELGWPLIGGLADTVVRRGFIEPIARRTLRTIKRLAEAEPERQAPRPIERPAS